MLLGPADDPIDRGLVLTVSTGQAVFLDSNDLRLIRHGVHDPASCGCAPGRMVPLMAVIEVTHGIQSATEIGRSPSDVSRLRSRPRPAVASASACNEFPAVFRWFCVYTQLQRLRTPLLL
jgi:hypothetical protein